MSLPDFPDVDDISNEAATSNQLMSLIKNLVAVANRTKVYTGHIDASGTITNAPTGWTGGAPASSVFTVTHNLGLEADAYEVFVQVDGTDLGAAIVETKGADSFTVETSDLATPSVADRAFSFMLVSSTDQ